MADRDRTDVLRGRRSLSGVMLAAILGCAAQSMAGCAAQGGSSGGSVSDDDDDDRFAPLPGMMGDSRGSTFPSSTSRTTTDAGTVPRTVADAGRTPGPSTMDAGGSRPIDEGPPLTCGASACGGMPFGTWTIVQICRLDPGDSLEACPSATLDASQATVTGTVTLGSDMRFEIQTNIGGLGRVSIPSSCVEPWGCGVIDGDGLDCDDGGPGCICTTPLSESRTDAGSFTVQDNELVLTRSDGPSERQPFCVSGGTMWVRTPGGDFLLTRSSE